MTGLACDLARRQIIVSINGDFLAPNGGVFSLRHLPPDAPVSAAFTAGSGAVDYNMGERAAFRFGPPADEFHAIRNVLEGGEDGAQLLGQAHHHTASNSSMAAAPERDDATASSDDARASREEDDRPTCDGLELLRKLGERDQGSLW